MEGRLNGDKEGDGEKNESVREEVKETDTQIRIRMRSCMYVYTRACAYGSLCVTKYVNFGSLKVGL